jgi:hypothetical protein
VLVGVAAGALIRLLRGVHAVVLSCPQSLWITLWTESYSSEISSDFLQIRVGLVKN